MASATLKDINGRRFSFAKLDAVNGIKLQLAIAKMAGAEITMLLSLFQEQASKAPKAADGSVDFAAVKEAMVASRALEEIGEILQRAATKADPDELVRLMILVFSKVVCDGKPILDINLTFGDDAITPWLVFVEGIKVNLGGFLAGNPLASGQAATPTQ